MLDFSRSRIISHRFYEDNNEFESVMICGIIIGIDIIVLLGISEYFKHNVILWDVDVERMKEPIGLIGKTYIISRGIREVVMQTAEPVSTGGATERLVKILNSTYAK